MNNIFTKNNLYKFIFLVVLWVLFIKVVVPLVKKLF